MRLILVLLGMGSLCITACSGDARQGTSSGGKHAVQPAAASSPGHVNQDSSATAHEHSSAGSHTHGHSEHASHAPHPVNGGPAHPDHHHANHHHPSRADHHSHSEPHSSDALGHHPAKVAIGQKVPDFEVTIGGQKRKLSDLRKDAQLTEDGTLVLTFWCSFCHSCREVEHQLDQMAQQYRGRVGVIALDASAGETTEGVTEFAKQHNLSLPIALTPGSTADLFGIGATTTTLVIDPQGVLRYRGQFLSGERRFAEDAVRSLLAGQEIVLKETPQRG